MSRGEGFTSPHLIRLAAVPLPALVNSVRVGMGKAGSKKMQKEKKDACVQDTQNKETRRVRREFVLLRISQPHAHRTGNRHCSILCRLTSILGNWFFIIEMELFR